jgi:hypothetical protein
VDPPAPQLGRLSLSTESKVKGAENFSWSGMSSAVRRLTQGVLTPSPHTSVIDVTNVYRRRRPIDLLASQIPHDAYFKHNGFIRDEGPPT